MHDRPSTYSSLSHPDVATLTAWHNPPLQLGLATQHHQWSINSAIAALPHNFTYCAHSVYPHPDLPDPLNPPADYRFRPQIPRSSSHSPVSNDGSHSIYPMDETVETSVSCRSSTKRSPSVKVEQSDGSGCFVMELSAAQVNALSLSQAMAPPTEVPLRVTHGSEEMRKMMGRFRIDPFAIHNGEQRGVVASWCEEACPLEEEPLIFEFQLDITGQEHHSKDSSDDASAGRASQDPSSDFDCDWERYGRDETVFHSTVSSSEWNIDSSGDQPPPPLSESPAGLYHHPLQELQESAYLRNCAEVDSQICEPYLQPVTSFVHDMRTQRVDHHNQFWNRRGAYDPASRITAYCADSPECDNAILPSISATVNRRWSVPDPNSAHTAQFLMH